MFNLIKDAKYSKMSDKDKIAIWKIFKAKTDNTMRTINVGNDYAFREQLKAVVSTMKEEREHDQYSDAGTEAAGATEQVEQANTQDPQAEVSVEEKKKGGGKKEKK